MTLSCQVRRKRGQRVSPRLMLEARFPSRLYCASLREGRLARQAPPLDTSSDAGQHSQSVPACFMEEGILHLDISLRKAPLAGQELPIALMCPENEALLVRLL